MAAFAQETVEEDAADLCFPKDEHQEYGGEFSMKTVELFEKFPKILNNRQLKHGINYLISIAGGHWFMYNGADKSILTGVMSDIYYNKPEARSIKPEVNSIKEFPISTSIPFQVSNLMAHPTQIGLLLLWGSHGLATVNIPVNNSDLKSDQIPAKILHEDLYVENVQLKTIQAKWDPSSSQVIVALHTDHTIRIYDIQGPDETRAEINLSGHPVDLDLCVESESLDVPTDFDFGPLLPKSNLQVIFVLQESGSLYYILTRPLGRAGKCYFELHGPLGAHDEVEDNVGVVRPKYSSLVSTKSFPIVITTGDLSNTLQNFILLPDDFDTDVCVMEEKVMSAEMKLYLHEKIILETVSECELNYLQLIPDPTADHRFACVTETGIYLVVLNFIPEVRLFLNSENNSLENLRQTGSTVRFLICWKVNDKSQPDKCLGGLTFCDPNEHKLLILLADLRSVLVDVNCSSYCTKIPVAPGASESSPTFGSDFQDIYKSVRTILKKDAAQPLMCSSQEIAGEDLEKFTIESLDLLVREYMERQEEAMNYLDCAISTVQVKSETMSENLEELVQAKAELRQAAEMIAERYEEAAGRNEMFVRRLQNLLHKQQKALPAMTDQERQWRRTLEDYGKDVEIYRSWIGALREKVGTEKDCRMNNRDAGGPLRLSSKQIAEIKNEIMRQHQVILKLTKEIKELKMALGVV